MKVSELSENRKKQAVDLPEYPGAKAVVPPPTPKDFDNKKVSMAIVRAHEALGALVEATSKLPNPNLVTRTLDRREAVRSSQIEGTGSEIDDLFAYETTGSDEGLPPDVQVTKNYVTALEYGLSEIKIHGRKALTSDLIKEIHRILMKDTGYSDPPGEYRTKQNWIGGARIYDARFVPPPCDRLLSCMKDYADYLQYENEEESFYEVSIVHRMAVAHAQYEMIHPFKDGNGRVGRLQLPMMLAVENFPPVYLAGYLKYNQRDYYDKLLGVQLREEWEPWIDFFATGVEIACREAIKTARLLEEILEKWKSKGASWKLRGDSMNYKVPEYLIANPVTTAHKLKEALDVSFPSASQSLAKFVSNEVLFLAKQQQRNRIFVAKEVIEILNRPTDWGEISL